MTDAEQKAFDVLQSARERVAGFSNGLYQNHAGGFIPGWWGWFRPEGGGTNSDWIPLALLVLFGFWLFYKPAEKPPERVVVAAQVQGTVSFQKLMPDGTWRTYTSEPGKELGNGQIQTPDGKLWTRNPDGTLSEIK